MDIFKCRTCGQETSDFRNLKSKTGKFNRTLDCRSCEREKAKNSRRARYATEEGRKAILEANDRYLKRPDIVERLSLLGRKRYADDLEFQDLMKDRAREWRVINHERKSETARVYYQNNKTKIYQKTREKESLNPWLRLRGHIRVRVCEALRAESMSKGGLSVFHNLPYTLMDLKKHLETHPNWDNSWMSWSCYGASSSLNNSSWQLDHIVPQIMFQYKSMKDIGFQLCWSLCNLRPQESHQNFADGNKSDLFGEFNSFQDIMDRLQNQLHNPPAGDPPILIMEKFKNLQLGESCPMTFYGLSYLDSKFLNRFFAKTLNNQSLIEATSDPFTVLRVITHLIQSGERITLSAILSNLKYITRTPGPFFPASACAIWRKYAPPGSLVFDPFLGWGGRTLGAICADVGKLVGCDLQSEVVDGCRKVAQDFAALSKVQTEFHHSDCLSFLRSTPDKYDLIFTSPPYMDTENYGVESDAMRQNWIDDFVFPFVEECNKHLASGGHIALHLKDLKGAPTFTAYHAAMKAAGFKQIARHRYGRTWTQAVYVYGII